MNQPETTVRERPILFSGSMVRALLAGTKTQTRRAWRDQPPPGAPVGYVPGQTVTPFGKPCDRLWVREAWRVSKKHDHRPPRDLEPRTMTVFFEAGGSIANQIRGGWSEDPEFSAQHGAPWVGKLRPSMFMPRWASRITLEIVSVKVERLQDISEADAIAEGIERGVDFPGWYRGPLQGDGAGLEEYGRTFRIPTAFPRLAYRALWESLNGPDSWAANPWVWVVEFKRIEA